MADALARTRFRRLQPLIARRPGPRAAQQPYLLTGRALTTGMSAMADGSGNGRPSAS